MEKLQKSPSTGGLAPRPPCLQRLGALPPPAPTNPPPLEILQHCFIDRCSTSNTFLDETELPRESNPKLAWKWYYLTLFRRIGEEELYETVMLTPTADIN